VTQRQRTYAGHALRVLFLVLVLLWFLLGGADAAKPPQVSCEPGYAPVCVAWTPTPGPAPTNTPRPTATATRTATAAPTAAATASPTAAPTASPTAPPAGADFGLSPSQLDFGTVAIGQAAPTQLVQISTVAGGFAVTITVPPPFVRADTHCEAGGGWDGVLGPNSHCDFAVGYQPTQQGSSSATLQVASGTVVQTVALAGQGIPATLPTVAPTATPTPAAAPTATVVLPIPTAGPGGAETPIPPQRLLDTSLPSPSGTVLTVGAGSSLQAALDAAEPGDVVELAAGATYKGKYILRNKPQPPLGWVAWLMSFVVTPRPPVIWLRSSQWQSLPAQGTRVAPADAAKMARIMNPDGTQYSALQFELGASHYYFTGLEITTTWASTTNTLWQLVSLGEDPTTGQAATQLAQLPDDVTFDRVYIHGTPQGNLRRGITANARAFAVVDSYVSDVHERGADNQAIGAWSAAGPVKLQNNYLEGACENTMWGGADTPIQGLVPSDFEIRGNHYRKLTAWKTDGQGWSIKNLIEFKNVQRALIDGNTFETWWASGQNAAVPITPRNQQGGNPWATTRDIKWVNNIWRDIGNGQVINILGVDKESGVASQPTVRVQFIDNLVDSTAYSPVAFQVLGGTDSIIIEHNTFLVAAEGGAGLSLDTAGGGPNTKMVFRNNIVANGKYGFCVSAAGCGNIGLPVGAPGIDLRGNLIYGAAGGGYMSNYQPNYYPPNLADVGVDGTTHKLAATSKWRGKATDGGDSGILTPK
jgi:hypothetical protein